MSLPLAIEEDERPLGKLTFLNNDPQAPLPSQVQRILPDGSKGSTFS